MAATVAAVVLVIGFQQSDVPPNDIVGRDPLYCGSVFSPRVESGHLDLVRRTLIPLAWREWDQRFERICELQHEKQRQLMVMVGVPGAVFATSLILLGLVGGRRGTTRGGHPDVPSWLDSHV